MSSLGVADRSELVAWARHLDELDVAHSDIIEASYGTAFGFVDSDAVALPQGRRPRRSPRLSKMRPTAATTNPT